GAFPTAGTVGAEPECLVHRMGAGTAFRLRLGGAGGDVPALGAAAAPPRRCLAAFAHRQLADRCARVRLRDLRGSGGLWAADVLGAHAGAYEPGDAAADLLRARRTGHIGAACPAEAARRQPGAA